MIVGGVDLCFGKVQMVQQIEGWIQQFVFGDVQCFVVEILFQCLLVEDKVDVECLWQCGFDFFQFVWVEVVIDQIGGVDGGVIVKIGMVYGIGDDFFDLGGIIVQFGQCCWN